MNELPLALANDFKDTPHRRALALLIHLACILIFPNFILYLK